MKSALAAILPGGDGSAFHFRALVECFKACDIGSVAVDLDNYSPEGEISATAFAQWAAQSIVDKLDPGQQCVLIAYSAGGGFAHIILKELQTLRPEPPPVAGMVLLDPLFKAGGGKEHPDMPMAVIGTSVLDELPAGTTDWPRLRKAVLAIFPTYVKRFKGFDTWVKVLAALEHDEEFVNGSIMPYVTCPMRLLTCTNFRGMEMFEGNAGGQECVPKWKQMVPHLTTQKVESSHVDIPFQSDTREAIVALMREVSPNAQISEAQLAKGKQAFDTTKAIMEKARKSFRDSFEKANPGDAFQLPGTAPSAPPVPPPPPPPPPPPEKATLEGLLAQLHLENFASGFEEEGYDDLETLKLCPDDELQELLDGMGMAAEDATAFTKAAVAAYATL